MSSLFIYWDPAKEIFTIPGINWPVRWYGLMWALAFILSHFFMNRIFKAEKRTDKQLDTLTIYIIVGTVLGARLGHCLFYGPLFDVKDAAGEVIEEGYLSHPLNMLKIYEGGLASHGGAFGIITAMWLYCRKTKESILWLFDRIVVVVPLAGMCIRIGNLINSEIVGTHTNLPWGFIFPQSEEDKLLVSMGGVASPRHPAQLYEAVYCLFLFMFMYWLWKNKRSAVGPGFMFGIMCVLLFTERFFVEFLKEVQRSFESELPLDMGQILSIPFVLVGIFMMWRASKLKAKASQS
jgi:prolipoprotein diacylglyceryl transferase